jgi:hypothetical protein
MEHPQKAAAISKALQMSNPDILTEGNNQASRSLIYR